MARRKRSLLGSSGRPPTGVPAPPRGGGAFGADGADEGAGAPDQVFEPDDDAGPQAEGVEAELGQPDRGAARAGDESHDRLAPDPDPLAEDDAPLLGSEFAVPAVDEGDDLHRPFEPAVGTVHDPPATPRPTVPRDFSDVLVLFDEAPSEQPLPDPHVQFDELPPGFSSSEGLPSGTPELARSRVHLPPAMDEDWFRDADGDLPTEEIQTAALEDFAGLYRAPMNVPEPPPIPGILDRFTPAPARPATGSGATDSTRPGFVPTPPDVEAPSIPRPRGIWDAPDPGGSEPAPVGSRAKREDPTGSRRDMPVWQDPTFLGIVAGAALFALVVLAGMAWLMLTDRAIPTAPEPASIAPVSPPMILRPPVDVDPGPVVDSDAPADGGAAGELDGGGEATEAPVTPTEVPVVAPRPPAPPQTRSATRTATRVAADKPGRIQVRTTRATLIYVNGQPVGMSPVDIERPPGAYTVHIVDKGKRVEKRVDLDAGATRNVEF